MEAIIAGKIIWIARLICRYDFIFIVPIEVVVRRIPEDVLGLGRKCVLHILGHTFSELVFVVVLSEVRAELNGTASRAADRDAKPVRGATTSQELSEIWC